MYSKLGSSDVDASTKQMSDHPEWRRMAQEIVTLRKLNAVLAEKVTTLEMQLERISAQEVDDEKPVSLAIQVTN